MYSTPPDWDEYGGQDEYDSGQDWGSGYVTVSNMVSGLNYCQSSGISFRTLTGLTEMRAGSAEKAALSAARSLSDALRTTFTHNGADVPDPTTQLIGVSGTPAWHVSLRGKPREPRHQCTPPVIRIDAISVATKDSSGAEAHQLFLLMSDEQEPDVVPTDVIDQVVASLRYDNSI